MRSFQLLRAVRTVACALVALSGAASVTQAQPLFRSDSLIDVTITTNLRDLVRERDSTELAWFGAAFSYKVGDSTVTVPTELRARGHFRRQKGNCSFPPLFVRVKGADARGTLLQGNPRTKITTSCRPGDSDYDQYILQEYGVYRMYQLLNPIHPRTRLARITYEDSAARVKPITVYAFFGELDEEVAKEHKMTLREEMKGARFRDVEPVTLQSMALFALMVGNSDWSLGALHNVYLLQDTMGVIRTVAYDWDWVGLLNTKYSRPDYRLPIKSVAERYYMGPCYTEAEWLPSVIRFQAAKPAIDSLWAGIPGLTDNKRQQVSRYLGQFWQILEKPKELGRMTKSCRAEGN
jgi:hypothetical protein